MFLLILPIALQVICVIHVVKTGKATSWIYIIVFLPVAGCIAYFIIEILPSFLGHSRTKEIGINIINKIAPTRRLKELENQLAISNTVNNKLDLANEYFKCGYFDKAIDLYNDCLKGVYKNDIYIMNNLGKSYVHSQKFEQAIAVFEKIKKESLSKESWLLYAYSLENLRAYPKTFDALKVIHAQARCNIAR